MNDRSHPTSARRQPSGTARDRLREYEKRRDFAATPEPRPTVADDAGLPRFVIHEHHARAMHWDLRLELDGTLWSWALPRGVPRDPKDNRLAVRTEDHPLEYLEFEGDIPPGNYGAGSMSIWDRGTFEFEKQSEREVIVRLHGDRVRGRHALFRTRGKNWMIHRMDPPEDPGRPAMPEHVRPMLAVPGALPRPPAGWAFEVKWDGVRAIGYSEAGRLRLESRNGNDITTRYPELRDLGRQLGSREAVLDGEIVALDDDGRPSFEQLQQRMHVQSEAAQRRLAREVPVVYFLFDLVWYGGESLVNLPYRERRARLEALALEGASWRVPPVASDASDAIEAFARGRGMEGMVAKRLDSPYEAGRRTGAWRKVKFQMGQELVVVGWVPGKGRREGAPGALLLGHHVEPGGPIAYAGKVGTGFTDSELDRLAAALAPLARSTSPVSQGAAPSKDARWVEPEIVIEVRFTEWTAAGVVRHAVYLGTRDDRDPKTVVRET